MHDTAAWRPSMRASVMGSLPVPPVMPEARIAIVPGLPGLLSPHAAAAHRPASVIGSHVVSSRIAVRPLFDRRVYTSVGGRGLGERRAGGGERLIGAGE